MLCWTVDIWIWHHLVC